MIVAGWLIGLPGLASGQSAESVPGAPTGAAVAPPRAEDTRGRDDPPETRFRLLPYLSFGATLELDFTYRKNADLDRSARDTLSLLEPELSVALSFDPHRSFQTFVEFELSREFALREEGESEKRSTKLTLEEAYVLLRDVPKGLSLQVGRQKFRDPREWLYDDELDAARLAYRIADFSFEFSASRKGMVRRDLLDDDEENDRINNYHAVIGYALTPKARVAAYVLAQDDRSADNESPIFLGLHSSGELLDGLRHWLELAHVVGRDGRRSIRGFGVDLGASYQLDLPLKPSLAMGYAFGSGDGDRKDRRDGSFRQTGFQENEGRFHGVTRFKYYGALFDPELSNLVIYTGGIGIRPSRRSSVDLVYHQYFQHHAADRIRDSAITADPTGRSRSIGREIDLVVGYREIPKLDIELVLGYFMPGRAFETKTNSLFVGVEVEFRF